MASGKFLLIFLVLFLNRVDSSSIFERSYEYVLSLGNSLGPNLMGLLRCLGEENVMNCAREKTGRILDKWDEDVEKQRRLWQAAADSEVRSSGRSYEELPSKLGQEVEDSMQFFANIVQNGVSRAFSRHHSDGQEVNLAISTSGGKKKKDKKKKKKNPPKIHFVHLPMDESGEEKRGFKSSAQTWSIGDKYNETNARKGRGIVGDLWALGEKGIDGFAQDVLEKEQLENEVQDKSGLEETRGKKKKKKKAILKLLILGAVLKAKIGTLLQILSFKLQVKFFIIALVGLGINLARFWLDLKKQHQQAPQKVIYYEHAQHQHHYEHEDEPGWGGGGGWSRSMDPEETDVDVDLDVNSPYRGQIDRSATYSRPHILSRPTK